MAKPVYWRHGFFCCGKVHSATFVLFGYKTKRFFTKLSGTTFASCVRKARHGWKNSLGCIYASDFVLQFCIAILHYLCFSQATSDDKNWVQCALIYNDCCNRSLISLRTWKLVLELLEAGNTNGEVSLYHWPPVWLVWNHLYENWQFLFLFAKQTNPNQSNRRSMVQWYFPL